MYLNKNQSSRISEETDNPYIYSYYDCYIGGVHRIAMLQSHYLNKTGAIETGRSIGKEINPINLPSDFGDWFTYTRFRKNDCYINVLSVDGN